jgi:hypothetical protein
VQRGGKNATLAILKLHRRLHTLRKLDTVQYKTENKAADFQGFCSP